MSGCGGDAGVGDVVGDDLVDLVQGGGGHRSARLFSAASRISFVLLACPHSSVADKAADCRSFI
jgi:hypothetical protein